MPFSWQRTVASTGLVLVTTLDDAVWLVPFVAGQRHAQIATTHAALFVATLEGMAITVCCVTALVQHQVLGTFNESQLTLVGLVLCWLLAVFLFYKKWQKRRRRRQQQQQQQQGNPTNNQAVKTENNPLLPVSAEREVQEHEVRETAQPWMVCSLTLLGSLDEMAYFPSLLLAGVFSPLELCLGTLLAAVVMLGVVLYALRPCQPLMQCLDRIPLYAVVTMFAILLTVEFVWEVCWENEDGTDDE